MPDSELRSVLSNDNKPFINSMNQAAKHTTKTTKGMAKDFDLIGSAIGKAGPLLAATFSVGAIVAGAKAIGTFASDIKDMSETLNMSTDSFQQYSFAISQSGGNQDIFVKGMIGLQQSMEEARDETSKAAVAFQTLGLDLDKIRSSSPDKVLLMISDAMKESGNSAEAFAALADLVGVKIATRLVPSLKNGSDEFLALGNSASIASQRAIDSAEAAQDAWDGFLNTVKTKSLNVFQDLVDGIQATIHPAQTALAKAAADDIVLNFRANSRKLMPGDTGYEEQAADEEADRLLGKKSGHRGTDKVNQGLVDLEEKQAKQAEKDRDAQEKADNERAKRYQDIQEIINETKVIELETSRDSMSNQELIVSLTAERENLLEQTARWEADIFSIHSKDAALARKSAADLQRQIMGVDRNIAPQTFTNSPRGRKLSAEENAAIDMQEKFGAFKNFNAFSTMGGSLSSGGLSSGGLSSGGMGEAYGKVRAGDAAKAKELAKAMANEKDPQLASIDGGVKALVKTWGGTVGGGS